MGNCLAIAPEKSFSFFYQNLYLDLILFFFYLYCPCFLFLVLKSDLESITKLSIVRLQTQLPPASGVMAMDRAVIRVTSLGQESKIFLSKCFFLFCFFSLLWIKANDRSNPHYFL